MSFKIQLRKEDQAFTDGIGPVFKDVKFFRTSWEEVPEIVFRKCAAVYCDVWREPPWNEDFWKTENVLQDMSRELARPGADCFIATYVEGLGYCEYENHHDLSQIPVRRSEEERINVLGFTWGYPVNSGEAREISGSDCLDGLFVFEEKVFYIDELAVQKFYRGQKIGAELSKLLIKSAKGQGSFKVILRTDKKATAAKKLYAKMGFRDLKTEDSNHPNRTYWLLEL